MTNQGPLPRVRFDQAFAATSRLAATAQAALGTPVVLVRNLTARILLIIDDREQTVPDDEVEKLDAELRARAGAYASTPGVARARDLIDLESLFPTDAAWSLDVEGERIAVFERTMHGDEWTQAPPPVADRPPRATVFGFKGGVGRSTAATALAVEAARRGSRCLLVDFDLESPGLGPTLLGQDSGPEFGLIDLLTEDVVGQLDGDLVAAAVGEASAVAPDVEGSIAVAPAGGVPRAGYEYVEKLARVDVAVGQPPRTIAERLTAALERLEEHVRPNLTIVDSRAGIEDVAATAVTQLGAISFLFAVDTPQTWHGYQLLFARWLRHPERLVELRDRLQMVAALLPAPTRADALTQFRDRSYELFSRFVYDAQAPGDTSGYAAALHDLPAPHNPLPVVWSDALLRFNPLSDRGWLAGPPWAALAPFAEGALELLGSDTSPDGD